MSYVSRVPRFTFDTTLAEQQAQLADNPLVQRMAESRRALAADPYRPIYHYVNPEGNLNDPNGLCFWKGRWHLFYQGYPPEDPRQHWGHAVSDDLIHWRDLPYAIYPDPEECCFSGSTLVEDGRVIAMYHGTQVGNMVAVADDPLLLNWEKLTGQPVIPFPEADQPAHPYTIFDPCIWKANGRYYALSGGQLPGPVANFFLLRSDDLIHWDYLHPFVEGDRFTLVGDDGACPYFWPIGDRHILLFFSHMSGGQYFLGDYDNDKLAVTAHGLFNFGPVGPGGVHAPSATPDGEGGVIVIFNMNPGKPTEGWNQIMTLPRRLSLLDRDHLRIEPAGDIESLRRDHHRVADVMLPANQNIIMDGVAGNAMELRVQIAPAPVIELDVLRSSEEYTRITIYREGGYRYRPHNLPTHRNVPPVRGSDSRHESLVVVDTARASILPDVRVRPPEVAPVYLAPDEPLDLRVFIDRSVVEVFINGKQCVAVRVYPGRADSTGVALRSQGQSTHLIALDAWQMATA